MLKINLIAVGKLKERYWRDAAEEYLKRLSSLCKAEIIELPEARLPDSPAEGEIRKALEIEAAAFSTYMQKKGTYNIAMCIEGGRLSSTEFSQKLARLPVDGYSTVNFIIGSSYGLSECVKSQCGLRLSMSEMTFPHQLARIMLLEQIYRAFQIQKGTHYHK